MKLKTFLKTMIVFVLCLNCSMIQAQEENRMPEYPGGEQAMLNYLYDNIKYPNTDRENGIEGIEGRVVVQFIVQKDGAISDIKILKGVSKLIDAEAIRVVKEMPKWKPGIQNGNLADAQISIPIDFTLEESPVVPSENVDFENISPKGWSFDLMVDHGRQFGDSPDFFKNPIGIGIGVNYHITRQLFGEYHSTVTGSRIQQTFNYQGTTWNENRKSGFFFMELSLGYSVVNNAKIRLAPYGGLGFVMHSPWKEIENEQVKTPLSFSGNVGLLLDVKRKFRQISPAEWTHSYIRFRLNFMPMNFKEDISGSILRLGVGIGVFSNHQNN